MDLDLASSYDYVTVNAGGSRSSLSLGVFSKGSPLGKCHRYVTCAYLQV